MSPKDEPSARLRTRAEFTAVQEQGRRIASRSLTLLGMPNRLPHDRLGIIASRRLGGAVLRNRAKRRIRELFRRERQRSGGDARRGFDLVVIPRRELASGPFVDIEMEFASAISRLRRT
jgi:ribonuclease P protein component